MREKLIILLKSQKSVLIQQFAQIEPIIIIIQTVPIIIIVFKSVLIHYTLTQKMDNVLMIAL